LTCVRPPRRQGGHRCGVPGRPGPAVRIGFSGAEPVWSTAGASSARGPAGLLAWQARSRAGAKLLGRSLTSPPRDGRRPGLWTTTRPAYVRKKFRCIVSWAAALIPNPRCCSWTSRCREWDPVSRGLDPPAARPPALRSTVPVSPQSHVMETGGGRSVGPCVDPSDKGLIVAHRPSGRCSTRQTIAAGVHDLIAACV